MTADVELLPLPSVLLNWPHPTNHVAIRDYARDRLDESDVQWMREKTYEQCADELTAMLRDQEEWT